MRHTILLVDDDQDTCELIRYFFQDYSAEVASTVAGAMRLARSHAFDLYLLDNWLPDGNGIDLCRQIRSLDGNTPIVFLSAAAYQKDHDEALEAGANAYMDKPADLSRLRDTVISLIRRSEQSSLEARVAELKAIRSSIDEYLAELQEQADRVDEKTRLARQRFVNAIAARRDISDRAYQAFTAAGGTKAHFQRLWPAALNEIWQAGLGPLGL